MEYTCNWCKKLFSTDAVYETFLGFCSDNCFDEWIYFKAVIESDEPKPTIKAICPYCNNEFETIKNKPKYCTVECYNTYKKNKPNKQSKTVKPYKVFVRDNFQCIYCGKSPIEDKVKLHADHVVPQILGGSDMANNIATACHNCNDSKHDYVFSQNLLEKIYKEIENRNIQFNIQPHSILYKKR